MNIYEILTKLVRADAPWTDVEKREALLIISGLEHINALGTATGQIELTDHDCERKSPWFPGSMQCQVCGKGMDPPPHACQPVETRPGSTGWGLTRTEIRCKICNKEMT